VSEKSEIKNTGRHARVLHVYKTYMPKTMGGVEQVIYQLLKTTQPLGYQHTVLILHPGPKLERYRFDGAEVVAVPWLLNLQSTPLSLRYLWEFSRQVAKADLIHYHFPFPLQDLAHLFLGGRRPSLVSYHSDVVRQKWLKPFYSPLMKAFLRRAQAIVPASPEYAASSQVLADYSDKIEVIPYGLERAAYPEPTPQQREHLRAQVGDGFFLFVGVLRYYKGLEYLLEAARKAGLPLVVAGDGPERPLVAAAAEANENIHYLGQVSDADKVALLQLSAVFVFPSHLRSEAFGISMLEAAMLGKPMISAEIGTGTSYINRHGETGLTVEPACVSALAKAMTTLAADKALAARYGVAARARFEAIFTAQSMGQRYSALYQKLLNPAALIGECSAPDASTLGSVDD